MRLAGHVNFPEAGVIGRRQVPLAASAKSMEDKPYCITVDWHLNSTHNGRDAYMSLVLRLQL